MIKVGIVGFGSMGQHHADNFFQGSDKFKLVAVCDPTEGRRKLAEQKYSVVSYENYAHFLKDDNLELVLVATPSNSHCEMAVEAMQAGKHCIVEKPMCLNASEAEKMMAVSRETGKMLSVFQNRRWDSDTRTVRQVVQSGVLGKIYQLKFASWGYSNLMQTYGVKEFRPQWRSEKKYGGGALYDFGAHYIDELLTFLESPAVAVFGDLKALRWTKDTDDFFCIIVYFANGVTAHLEYSQSSLATYGTGWLINGEKGGYKNGAIITGEPGKLKEKKVKELPSDWGIYYENIYEVLTKGADLLVKPEQVRRVMLIMDAARESNKKQQVVSIKGW